MNFLLVSKTIHLIPSVTSNRCPLLHTLTCPCRRISLVPPPALWQRCHRRCASGRSPWWGRPSCRWWRQGRLGRWSPAGRSAQRRTRWSARRWSSPGKPANMWVQLLSRHGNKPALGLHVRGKIRHDSIYNSLIDNVRLQVLTAATAESITALTSPLALN